MLGRILLKLYLLSENLSGLMKFSEAWRKGSNIDVLTN